MKKFKHIYKKSGEVVEKTVLQSYIEKYYELDELDINETETLALFLVTCNINDFWSNGVETFICL